MPDGSSPDVNPYPTEAQNAIFNFVFILVEQYAATGMSKHDAMTKACDWVISLGTHLKKESNDINDQLLQKQKLFTNPK